MAYCPLEKRIQVSTGIYPHIKEVYLYEDAKHREGLQAILHVNLDEPSKYNDYINLYFRDGLDVFADADILKEQEYVEYLKIILSELNANVEIMEIFQRVVQEQSIDGFQRNK
jgi:tryptophan 2,3-dioxygenase